MDTCRKSGLRVGMAVVALLVGALQAGTARADCTKDTDCKGDRICNQGQCVSPMPAAPPPAPGLTPPPPPPDVLRPTTTIETAQPPPPSTVYVAPPAMQLRLAHPALHGWGIGLFVFGAVLDLAGTITFVAGSSAESTYCGTGNSGCKHGAEAETAGEVLWAFGGVFTLTGYIMWQAGNAVVAVPVQPSTAWMKTVTPFVSPTKDGAKAGVVVTF